MGFPRYADRDKLTPVATPHRIAVHGLCDDEIKHDGHIFVDQSFFSENQPYLIFWDCPGQYSACRNCDDRYCMACVTREVHNYCINDCPMCCEPELLT